MATTTESNAVETSDFDFIIVGSGAGGGPLAARLAQNGCRVLLMEAGSNTAKPPRGPDHEVSLVPSLHAVSTEHPDLSWEFFVKHYDRPPTGQDPKWHQPDASKGEDATREGIFYPRAAALGGCTIHNAMITIAGPDSDWDDLADFLQDDSWRSSKMRAYFRRLEHNDYTPEPTPVPKSYWGRTRDEVKWLCGFEPDHTRGKHGFNGWLHTSVTDISLGLTDKQLIAMLTAALEQAKKAGLERAGTLVRRFVKGEIFDALDPNHSRTQAESPEGLVLIPLSVCGPRTDSQQDSDNPDVRRGRRSSPRELLIKVQKDYPDNLVIWTECLVTKVLFEDGPPPRAVGVEYIKGERLYKAHPQPRSNPGTAQTVRVKPGGEVILAGGSFNTPQLLMLSGVGNQQELQPLWDKEGIQCRADLPGVGQNLQDRYEVTLISEMDHEFSLLRDATFSLPRTPEDADRHLREWRASGTGLYTSNGAVLGIFKRSRPDLEQPDLFIFGVPLPFKGYEVGYSNVGDQHNFFTWTILKAHTNNRGGVVELRSGDPLETPQINFHYFNEMRRPDKGAADPDLLAILDGVKFVRGIARHAEWVVKREYHPGTTEVGDNDDQIKNWIRRVAWGHHACGTCRMGPEGDSLAVLDSRFRVRGVAGLRVVDASIFPNIPGYFIVTNIYMASEKAADVILADYRARSLDTPKYPRELRERELAAINMRRSHLPAATGGHTASAAAGDDWAPDVTGLCLSGGGIRSATLGLGLIQTLAKSQALRRFDFLSTVSGGGYIGSFLGRFYDRLRPDPQVGSAGIAPPNAPEYVEQDLSNPSSAAVAWLRKHGNYIAPNGRGDWRLAIAAYLRNFLSVHFVIGLLLFALFGVANAIRYGLFDPGTAGLGLVLVGKGDLPLGNLLQSLLGPFFSPWFVICELVLLFCVLPRIIGYWIVSQDRHERFHGPALTLLFVAGAILLYLGVSDGLATQPLTLGLAMFTALVPVEAAWRLGRTREESVGSGGVETQRLRTRNYLTYDLGLYWMVAGFALGFAVVDTLGHGLQQWLVDRNIAYTQAFAMIGVALVTLLLVARSFSSLFLSGKKSKGTAAAWTSVLTQQILAGLPAVVLLSLPLIFYAFAAHVVYQGGSALTTGLAATAVALLGSLILRFPAAVTFVNRSSLAQVYSARLARAYLGASNPLRRRPDGANITEVIAGDDVPSIRNYQPHAAGGPFHLINSVVNQTIDFTSQRGSMDRKGESLAVSSLGLSVGQRWHSLWADPPGFDSRGRPAKRPALLRPAGLEVGDEHPLVDEAGDPADQAEMLSLRQWIAISGADLGPSRGQNTMLGTALLFGLTNVRTGYWWDSGIADAARDGFPRLTFLRRLFYLAPRFFRTQSLLLSEWLARFAGPWERYWNLSDGGPFDTTGCYELIRRRIPRLVLCDGSADPTYDFEIFAELVRKVRIDFQATIRPFTAAELDNFVPQPQRAYVGTPPELRPAANGQSLRHATLYWIDYDDCPQRKSVLLYLKASLTGDESDDIANYRASHPTFPHESTSDQVFDEAQWESYRQLGEHLSAPLFSGADWFWTIPLQ